MGNFFDIDGGVMGTLGKIADVIILSLLFLLFSLPVFTMGASFTALYYTSVKCIRRGRGYLFKSFWTSFRENFAEATSLWLLFLIAGGLLGLNVWFSTKAMEGSMSFILTCIYVMMGFTIFLIGIYLFPVLSRFHMSRRKLITTAFYMAVRHLPYSILLALIFSASVLGVYIIIPLIFILPAAGSILFSLPMERVLKKYIKSSGDESQDEWYLE